MRRPTKSSPEEAEQETSETPDERSRHRCKKSIPNAYHLEKGTLVFFFFITVIQFRDTANYVKARVRDPNLPFAEIIGSRLIFAAGPKKRRTLSTDRL